MPETIYDKNYNFVNIYLEHHTVNVGPNNSPDIVLGSGYDMNEIEYPLAKGVAFDDIDEVRDHDDLEIESDPQHYEYFLHQVTTIAEEMSNLSVSFSGSYGMVSGSVSYEQAKKNVDESNIFYLELISRTGSSTIRDITSLSWTRKPIAEDILDVRERFKQFVNDQGTHFVRTIYYGSKFVVRASTRNKSQEASEKLRLALNAVGASYQAKAELSYEHKATLQSADVEIGISILGKVIAPDDAQKNPIFKAVSFEKFMGLLEDIANGKAKIISCPIRCEVESYRYRLNQLPKCKEIYSQVFLSQPAESPYGVPSGTVISWIPQRSNCRFDDIGVNVLEIIPPKGWVICDSNSIYNLDGMFCEEQRRSLR